MANMKYKVDEDGCHIWTRAKNSRGYGVVWHDGKVRLAHRVAFEIANGRPPTSGLVIDHICNVKECVNPVHLRELENWQNLRRAVPRGNDARERLRARQRKADAKRRGNYRYMPGGEGDFLVQG